MPDEREAFEKWWESEWAKVPGIGFNHKQCALSSYRAGRAALSAAPTSEQPQEASIAQEVLVTPDHDGSPCGQCGVSGMHLCKASTAQPDSEQASWNSALDAAIDKVLARFTGLAQDDADLNSLAAEIQALKRTTAQPAHKPEGKAEQLAELVAGWFCRPSEFGPWRECKPGQEGAEILYRRNPAQPQQLSDAQILEKFNATRLDESGWSTTHEQVGVVLKFARALLAAQGGGK
jgi:hypothetical protein